jgi:hypothetical protein
MKIEINRNGDFEIKLYKIRGKTKAKNIEELKLAIEHYFGKVAHFTKENNWKGLKNCPLCSVYKEVDI